MGWVSKLAGIIGTTFQLDAVGGGPKLKANAGAVEARDAADVSFAIVRGGTPVANNDLATKQYADGIPTSPGAYPYTTLATDTFIEVDSVGGARTIELGDGAMFQQMQVADAGDNAGANNITVGLSNAGKKLNGTVNGTVVISTNGQLKRFWRDTAGNWHGGV